MTKPIVFYPFMVVWFVALAVVADIAWWIAALGLAVIALIGIGECYVSRARRKLADEEQP